MRHFTTLQSQSGGKHSANTTGGLAPSLRKARVCLRTPRSTSPTSATSDPPPLSASHVSPPDLPLTQTCKMHHLLSTSSFLLLSVSPSLSLSLSFQSIPVAAPREQWCNPPSPVRNHRLELARCAEQGRHHTKSSAGKQQERKDEKGEIRPITQENQCELVNHWVWGREKTQRFKQTALV